MNVIVKGIYLNSNKGVSKNGNPYYNCNVFSGKEIVKISVSPEHFEELSKVSEGQFVNIECYTRWSPDRKYLNFYSR